ncbi:hypothetical protein ScPMuIL_002783 [Solemya velum]
MPQGTKKKGKKKSSRSDHAADGRVQTDSGRIPQIKPKPQPPRGSLPPITKKPTEKGKKKPSLSPWEVEHRPDDETFSYLSSKLRPSGKHLSDIHNAQNAIGYGAHSSERVRRIPQIITRDVTHDIVRECNEPVFQLPPICGYPIGTPPRSPEILYKEISYLPAIGERQIPTTPRVQIVTPFVTPYPVDGTVIQGLTLTTSSQEVFCETPVVTTARTFATLPHGTSRLSPRLPHSSRAPHASHALPKHKYGTTPSKLSLETIRRLSQVSRPLGTPKSAKFGTNASSDFKEFSAEYKRNSYGNPQPHAVPAIPKPTALVSAIPHTQDERIEDDDVGFSSEEQ